MTKKPQEPLEQVPAPAGGRGTIQLGQVAEGGERRTRRLPRTTAQRPHAARPNRAAPPREQLATLIEALGDATHPLHAGAIDELVALGGHAVPALCEVLHPKRPWLTVYRAAEAAGRIGDGRATGPLIHALGHANGNVRWSAIRALTEVGDVRAVFELRRLAQHDPGRTSWGESVAGAAQSALSELGRRSIWGQGFELIKTAVVAILMILALILAFSVATTLRTEFDRFGRLIPGQTVIPRFTLPTATPQPTAPAAPAEGVTTAAPTLASTQGPTPVLPPRTPTLAPTTRQTNTGQLSGTILRDAFVRPFPTTQNRPIGRANQGDEIVFLAQTTDGQWFLISLGPQHSSGSAISSADGSGWINQALVTAPTSQLPVQEPVIPTPLAATATTNL